MRCPVTRAPPAWPHGRLAQPRASTSSARSRPTRRWARYSRRPARSRRVGRALHARASRVRVIGRRRNPSGPQGSAAPDASRGVCRGTRQPAPRGVLPCCRQGVRTWHPPQPLCRGRPLGVLGLGRPPPGGDRGWSRDAPAPRHSGAPHHRARPGGLRPTQGNPHHVARPNAGRPRLRARLPPASPRCTPGPSAVARESAPPRGRAQPAGCPAGCRKPRPDRRHARRPEATSRTSCSTSCCAGASPAPT